MYEASIVGPLDRKSPDDLFNDLALLAGWQQHTLGQDPDHPVLRAIQADMDDESALWLSMLYMAYMNLPSALTAFYVAPEPTWVARIPREVLQLPKGFERRGLRVVENMMAHLAHIQLLMHGAGSMRKWLESGFGDDPVKNWETLQLTLQAPVYNGRWAAYNTGEILMNNHKFNVLPGDMGNRASSGPRSALVYWYQPVYGNGDAAIAELDRQAAHLLARVQKAGVDIRIDELETVLCDFHSMVGGKHYIGNYPDLLLQQIAGPTYAGMVKSEILMARYRALPRWSLGEIQTPTWWTERKELLKAYKDHGVVEWWTRYPDYPSPERRAA